MHPADLERDTLYAYVEYPKAGRELHEQPKPVCVELVAPKFKGALVKRVDGRSWVNESPAGGVPERERLAYPDQIVSTWGDLIAAIEAHERHRAERDAALDARDRERRRMATDAIEWFAELPASSTEFADLQEKLDRFLLHGGVRTVTLDLDEIVAIANRIREQQEIISQNALLALPEGD